ncbi:MAG TPA: hypothetical protein DC045_12770, partial [Marinobacter adhaerens]|nr:hypothetical protein [Marinobacter adhaerens]
DGRLAKEIVSKAGDNSSGHCRCLLKKTDYGYCVAERPRSSLIFTYQAMLQRYVFRPYFVLMAKKGI